MQRSIVSVLKASHERFFCSTFQRQQYLSNLKMQWQCSPECIGWAILPFEAVWLYPRFCQLFHEKSVDVNSNESMDALIVFAYLPNWTWLGTLNKCIKHIVYDIKPKWVFGGVCFLCGLCTKWQTTEISMPRATSWKVIRQTRAHLCRFVSVLLLSVHQISLHIWNWFLIKNLFKRLQLASQRCHNEIYFAENPIEWTN